MEGGALFDPGVLGGQFLWWIGQIPDDATWRDNIVVGKHDSKDKGKGWGRRYKVRIMGIHDQEEETIPSDQLPWANVMYPVTAGSGAANAYQTPQIRQGNFVFGFWLDGPDQQVPVIMGILGNNPQTPLKTETGTSEANFSGTSGYAESQDPPPERARTRAPESDLITRKPRTPEEQRESAQDTNTPQNDRQFQDAQSARAAAQSDLQGSDLSQGEQDAIVNARMAAAVRAGIEARDAAASSASAAAQPGATIEAMASSPHLKGAADIVKDDFYRLQTPLLKPDKKVESSQKAIQTELDNLAVKTRKHLKSMTEYRDAVSLKVDMEKEVAQTAKDIAKFEKVSVDKLMEYSLKSMNASIAETVADLPAAKRFQYADVKEGFTKKLMEEYLNITNGLADSAKGLLDQKLDLPAKEAAAMAAAASVGTATTTPTYADAAICTSEEFLGKSIALQKTKINDANKAMINNMNLFLGDISSEIAGVLAVAQGGLSVVNSDSNPSLPSIPNLPNQINVPDGSVTSALQFENLLPNRFPFELPPNPSVSDFYTLAAGSGAQPDSATPSPMAIGQIAGHQDQVSPSLPTVAEIPFAEPSKDQLDIDLLANRMTAAAGNAIDNLQSHLDNAQNT